MSLIVDGTTGVTFNDSSLQGAAASPYVLKNRIINGDMRIDQRNAGASGTANAYTVDRFYYYGAQASKGTWQQNAGSVTPPAGFTNYLGFTSSSAYSVISTDTFTFNQAIEGLNCADLGWGSANAKTVTLSFWVRSSLTGTFCGSIQNSASNRSYGYTYTISSANTWEQKSITISGDTTGTWLTTNGVGIRIYFTLAAGSGYQTATPNTWQANDATYTVSGATSVVGTNGATWYITGVQLEIGTSATPFERRMITNELNLCKRYYEKSYDYSVVPGTTTNVGRWNAGGTDTGRTTGRISGNHIVFQVEKRAIPTVTSYDAVGNSGKCTRFTLGTADNNNQGVYIADSSTNGWFPFADPSGTNDSGCGVHWVASAEL